MPGPRYTELLETAGRYKELAAENYDRIRKLAEALQSGFCAYLGSDKPPCVRLVPPAGPFEPKEYGDAAFSVPSKGFRPLGAIHFGLAVRVSDDGDWLRLALAAEKEGETFTLSVHGGPAYDFALPLKDQDPTEFFAMLHTHVRSWFSTAIEEYEHGDYGQREIGFDFFRED